MVSGKRVVKFGGEMIARPELTQSAIEVIRQLELVCEKVVVVCTPSRETGKLLNETAQAATKGENGEWKAKLGILVDTYLKMASSFTADNSSIKSLLEPVISQIEDVFSSCNLLREFTDAHRDLLFGLNGRLTALLFTELLRISGKVSHSVPHFLQATSVIKTNNVHGKALIDMQKTHLLVQSAIGQNGKIFVISGGMGSCENNKITYLGRNGSEYTAATIAAAIKAEQMEAYTLIDGIMTADPAYVSGAFPLPEITYNEVLEMSFLGMHPLYAPALHPAISAQIPILFKNLKNLEFKGTRIAADLPTAKRQVRGIVSLPDAVLLHLTGSDLPRIPDVASRFQKALEDIGLAVAFFSKPFSGHSITAAIRPKMADKAIDYLQVVFKDELERKRLNPIEVLENHALLAIVGEGMKNRVGTSAKFFTQLARNGINIVAASQGAGQMNHTVAIGKQDLGKALNILHESFFLSETKTLNMFLVGPGLIGKTLLSQIQQQEEFLRKSRNLKIRVIAIANSKKMLFDKEGIAIEGWKERFETSALPKSLSDFVTHMKDLNLPNSVFVDATASDEPINFYESILESSIAIVTPNKRANSGPLSRYYSLKTKALMANTQFLYETNVGAGLPIVNTLKDLIYSGDSIKRIDAILSGTISFIFNSFSAEKSFGDTVKEAKALGYTEPDPRDDLNGKDMARKILILAREIGLEIEPDDISIEQILPPSAANAATVDEFFEKLDEERNYFDQMRENAESQGKKLRFIGTIEGNKVYVKLRAVEKDHPFYTMKGADNIISFVTERYKEDMPLLVRGPGAGAEVTAAGVFAEIIQLSR